MFLLGGDRNTATITQHVIQRNMDTQTTPGLAFTATGKTNKLLFSPSCLTIL